MDQNYVVIEHSGLQHKILKITPHKDGGFDIHAPYHRSEEGYISKLYMPYIMGDIKIPINESIEQFYTHRRVKLSIHRSGFVQFSGKGITSGLDDSGKPRGLAINSLPLDTPVDSGPTFAVTVWGTEDFVGLDSKKKTKNYICFGEQDFYYRQTNKDNWNAYIIEGFVFPNRMAGLIDFRDELTVTLQFMRFEIPGTVFRLKVIILKNAPSFIGLLASRINRFDRHGVSEMPSSGFMLGGPSHQPVEIMNGVPTGECLFATYPRTSFFEGDKLKPIDYKR